LQNPIESPEIPAFYKKEFKGIFNPCLVGGKEQEYSIVDRVNKKVDLQTADDS
jgi:hypothetical protein